MQKMLLALSLLFMTTVACASSMNVNGQYVRVGDHLSRIYDQWGSPQYRVTSDKTCHVFDKKKCSYSRLVWKREGVFYMVQEIRSRIIKMKATRSESEIRKSF